MKKNVLCCCAFLLSAALFSKAQDAASFKRQAYILHLAVDKGNFYEQNLPEGDFIKEHNTLQLYPGEKIYLEATVAHDTITTLRAVPLIIDSSRTITVNFSQQFNKKIHTQMMLVVTNPFPQELKYAAVMYLLKAKKWVPTSILPIPPKLQGYEFWPDIIITLAMNNWSLGTK